MHKSGGTSEAGIRSGAGVIDADTDPIVCALSDGGTGYAKRVPLGG